MKIEMSQLHDNEADKKIAETGGKGEKQSKVNIDRTSDFIRELNVKSERRFEENSPRLAMERDLKSFEAMRVLNHGNSDKKEKLWYLAKKKEYAEKYLDGNEPEQLINSIDELKRVLNEIDKTGSLISDVIPMEARLNKENIDEENASVEIKMESAKKKNPVEVFEEELAA